ncbi:MAG: carboxypeptidase-like regulatory domain-containing protein [Candidatus Acidiferrales bacterium]
MKSALRIMFAFFLVAFAAKSALPQSRNTGEIRGVVTDTTGAVVPNVTVTVTNIDTGVVKTYVTDKDGLYDTVSTPTGRYNITFSVAGFKKVSIGPVTLNLAVITENAKLQVGAVTESVTVSAGGAPLLQTETSSQETVLQAQTIDKLPQVGAGITGNDWANFNILLPGASSAPSQPASEGSGSYNAGDAVSLNGNLPNYANYLQDGGVVQLPVSNNVDNTVFSAVSEVQVTTSSFSAEYGIGGAVFNQITKSGTNRFHGSAYEYWQNNILNARPFFPVGGKAAQTPYLRYDEWGGSIGGPIIKNKLFFYFVRDKIYDMGAAAPHVSTVPTLAERGMGTANPGAYDFTGLAPLYDPTSCSTPGCARVTFASENTGALAGVNAVPAGAVDPVALKILGYYPLPNLPGSPVPGFPGEIENNFSFVASAPNPNLRYFGRIDYNLSQNNTLSGSISQKNNNGYNINQLPCPLNCFSGDIDGYNGQVTDVWTIKPTMVNELRMAYTKQGNWFVPATIGFDAAGKLGLAYAKNAVFPNIDLTSPYTNLNPGTNAVYIENLYDPSDVLTLIKGKHILHFGVEVLMGEGNTTPWGNIDSGTFNFNGNYTAQNGAAAGTTGSSLADFLLGDVQQWGATNQAVSYARLKSPQAFVQDDYKVRSNLTVNLGLRYTGTTGFSEIHNSLGGFDPNITLVCGVDKNGTPCGAANGTLGSMWFAPQDNRTTLQKPDWHIFLPRVGFAWSPINDTVIRGGFGLYSYNYSQDVYGNGVGAGALQTSRGSSADPNAGTGPNPLIHLDSPLSVANTVLNYVVGSPNAKNISNYLNVTSPSNQTYVPYNVSPGEIYEWQFSVQHEFARNYAAEVAYVGSHGANLQFPTDINQITNLTVLNEIAAGTATVQPNRPFPYWGQLGGNHYNAISNYKAIQAQVTKRFSSGLMFNINYVWSHFQDSQDSGGWGSRGGTQDWQIGNDPAANYGNSNFDIPNALKGYVSYDLPFGKGGAFMNNGGTAEDYIFGGWRIAGTFITQSGNPFTVTNNTNENSTFSGCGNGCSWYPNVVGSTSVSNPGPNEWFNTAAFVNAAPAGQFAFGNEVRNSLRGPRLTVVNLSLAKSIAFTEGIRLELRADFVNALNHPSLNIPGDVLGGSNFGQINSATAGNGVTVAPRSGQLSAVVTF